jgi:hypothetical protein
VLCCDGVCREGMDGGRGGEPHQRANGASHLCYFLESWGGVRESEEGTFFAF